MGNPPAIRICALGRVRVYRDERELTTRDWTYNKARELLVYLACHPPRTKEQVGLALWPEVSAAQLRNNFRVTLFHARHALGSRDWIRFENNIYEFNRGLSYTLDVDTFEQKLVEAGRLKASMPARAVTLLQEAAQVYAGDFCEDLSDGEWHLARQAELQRRFLDALLTMAQLLFAERRFAQAADVYRQAMAKDNYREAAHRGLMRCLAQMGESGQALQHFQSLTLLLQKELGQKPEPETTSLFERLRSGEEDSTRAPSTPYQAPARTARFVGRERELADLGAALTRAGSPRICGLAGMGGIGKTTLAIELAHALRRQFADGVLWAHVATSEPMAILDSWARAYQCDYSALPDLESRAAAMRSLLADKQALLILDDVWSAERARPLLLGGPQCSVLFTSRNLEVAAALDARLVDMPTLSPAESRQLFVRILGAARVEAAPEAADEITRLLGQLPLALEIAAKRLALNLRWSLHEMATRLRDQFKRLDELQVGDKAVRASFAISWELLQEPLRRLFAHLAVFEGRSFTASALAAAANAERGAATDGLDGLVALSLLSNQGTVHYRQHPLLADFAREKLTDSDEAGARVAQYYLSFATEHQSDYLALEDEWENLSAGLQTAHRQQQWQNVVDYAGALTPAWFARGRFSDARQAYPLAGEAATAEEDQDAYIAAMLKWGQACIEQGDYTEAKEHLERGLQVCRDVDDQAGIAHAEFLQARLAIEMSNYDVARTLLEESQRIRQKLNDMSGVAETLYMQSRIHFLLRDYAEAERLGSQALIIQEAMPSNHACIVTLRWLAVTEGRLDKYDIAVQHGQQAMAMCAELQDNGELGVALLAMSILARLQGQIEVARNYADQSLSILKQMGDRKSQAQVLHQMSLLASDAREYELALQNGLNSLAMFRELGDALGVATVLRYTGDICKELNQLERACEMWSEALRLIENFQHPWLNLLRERLELNCRDKPF